MTAVGILALQGAVAAHREMFRRLGHDAREVRRPEDLDGLTHLVLPGGESTTIHHLLELFGLRDEILARHGRGELALFGTCAGAILLGRDEGEAPPRLGVLDATVKRNAYGRQIDSFQRRIDAAPLGRDLVATFIRAPRFGELGPGVRVLGRDGDEPVIVSSPGIVASTFHPELGDDPVVHEAFLDPDLWQSTGKEN